MVECLNFKICHICSIFNKQEQNIQEREVFWMQEYLAMWKNYFNFNDRTTVRGYWMVMLINVIIGIILSALTLTVSGSFYYLTSIYSLVGMIPGIALSVRRLHDINKSGWWLLISLVPLVGVVILIVWFCFGSVDENNRYGNIQV